LSASKKRNYSAIHATSGQDSSELGPTKIESAEARALLRQSDGRGMSFDRALGSSRPTCQKPRDTFINFRGVYPNQTFTGWISAGTPLAADASIPTLQGKKIKITGRIELYRGKPEIKVLSKSQITEE
jgi:hypothetical protein